MWDRRQDRCPRWRRGNRCVNEEETNCNLQIAVCKLRFLIRRSRQMLSRLCLVGLAVVTATLPACTSGGNVSVLGYSTKPLHDTEIRTVRVPIFENRTFRRGLEFDLTKEVIRQIEQKTPY